MEYKDKVAQSEWALSLSQHSRESCVCSARVGGAGGRCASSAHKDPEEVSLDMNKSLVV